MSHSRPRHTRNCKARYKLATKLNSTRSTLLKVHCCRNRQQIGNNLNSTACRGRHCRQLGRLCCLNVERPFDFVASVYGAKETRWTRRLSTKSTVLNSSLSPVCIGLKAAVIFSRILFPHRNFSYQVVILVARSPSSRRTTRKWRHVTRNFHMREHSVAMRKLCPN